VFVTGRGGAGFHLPDPALTRGRGGYFSGNHRPAPLRGPPALIPWTGTRLLPGIFNGDPSEVWVGWGPEREQRQGMPKKTPRPRQLSGAGRGKRPGARVFRGPVRPVTNSNCYHENAPRYLAVCRAIPAHGTVDNTPIQHSLFLQSNSQASRLHSHT